MIDTEQPLPSVVDLLRAEFSGPSFWLVNGAES